ncbi:MAG: hypothetical protein ABIR48_04455 [Gammaproteobacteria bacterium]
MTFFRTNKKALRARGSGQLTGVLIVLLIMFGLSMPVSAQDNQRVLQAFESQTDKRVQLDDALAISTKQKHKILFFMGITLLIGVLVTAGLGIAMGVYGKPVFVAHMLSAGLTVTLAIIHAVVAIVWFFPF